MPEGDFWLIGDQQLRKLLPFERKFPNMFKLRFLRTPRTRAPKWISGVHLLVFVFLRLKGIIGNWRISPRYPWNTLNFLNPTTFPVINNLESALPGAGTLTYLAHAVDQGSVDSGHAAILMATANIFHALYALPELLLT